MRRTYRVGDVHGRLCIVSGLDERPGYVLCDCDCGNQTIVHITHLQIGHIRSCGCLRQQRRRVEYIYGKRFGALTALHPASTPGHSGPEPWRVQCDCGKALVLTRKQLQRMRHCGCVTHWVDTSPFGLHFCIRRNTARCLAYARQHHIPIDRRLFASVDAFLGCMPSPLYSHSVLERKDERLPFFPENLEWKTYALPAKMPDMHEYRGLEMDLKHWAEHLQVSLKAMQKRYADMPHEDAFDPRVRRRSTVGRRGRGMRVG